MSLRKGLKLEKRDKKDTGMKMYFIMENQKVMFLDEDLFCMVKSKVKEGKTKGIDKVRMSK